jgi:hypothetical protein
MDLYLQTRKPGTYLVNIRLPVGDLWSNRRSRSETGVGGDSGETCLMLCLCVHGRVKNWECPHLP